MKNNDSTIPSFPHRIWSVWTRHLKVYTNKFLSNAFEPVLEPLLFMMGIGFGLGIFIQQMDGVPYIQFLASGLLIATAMMTSALECAYSTFVRLEFDKVYDGMVAAPLTAENILLGEIIWAGTKGLFFSLIMLLIVYLTGIIRNPWVFTVPLIGFLTGLMFGSFSMLVTSFVKNFNHFSFYVSGFLSPMWFFSGLIFPVNSLPPAVRPLVEILPLTHPVRIARAICFNRWGQEIILDFAYIVVFILVFGYFGIKRLKKKIID